MGQKEQGVILHGWTTGRTPESDICPVFTCTRVVPLPREQEALRVVRHAIVNLDMDYYNSLYMELSLNAILKASTHATIAVLLATISDGLLLVVTWKDLHGSGLLYNHPPSPGWISWGKNATYRRCIWWPFFSGMVPIPGITPWTPGPVGPFTLWTAEQPQGCGSSEAHLGMGEDQPSLCLWHWTAVSCLKVNDWRSFCGSPYVYWWISNVAAPPCRVSLLL